MQIDPNQDLSYEEQLDALSQLLDAAVDADVAGDLRVLAALQRTVKRLTSRWLPSNLQLLTDLYRYLQAATSAHFPGGAIAAIEDRRHRAFDAAYWPLSTALHAVWGEVDDRVTPAHPTPRNAAIEQADDRQIVGHSTAAVRAWAAQQGESVAARGRLSRQLYARYERAQELARSSSVPAHTEKAS